MSVDAETHPESETKRVLEVYAAAWKRGDTAAMFAVYDDHFTLRYFGRNALSGEHAGKPAALAALAEFTKRTGRRLSAILDVMAGPNLGAFVVREKMGPEQIEVERVLVYTVGGGRMLTCSVFDENSALIDRLVGA